jgi:hypothetical protein
MQFVHALIFDRMENSNKAEEVEYIYRRWITTKDGRRIYPKNGKVFKIPVKKKAS